MACYIIRCAARLDKTGLKMSCIGGNATGHENAIVDENSLG